MINDNIDKHTEIKLMHSMYYNNLKQLDITRLTTQEHLNKVHVHKIESGKPKRSHKTM